MSIELISMQRQCMTEMKLVILLLYRSPNAPLQSLADDDSSAIPFTEEMPITSSSRCIKVRYHAHRKISDVPVP